MIGMNDELLCYRGFALREKKDAVLPFFDQNNARPIQCFKHLLLILKTMIVFLPSVFPPQQPLSLPQFQNSAIGFVAFAGNA